MANNSNLNTGLYTGKMSIAIYSRLVKASQQQ